MPAVNAQNFEAVLTPDMRDEFWRRVKFSLRHFFGETEDLADRYRDMVEAYPIGQQLLVYHDDPLKIAAELAGADATWQQHADDYRRRFPDVFHGLDSSQP